MDLIVSPLHPLRGSFPRWGTRGAYSGSAVGPDTRNSELLWEYTLFSSGVDVPFFTDFFYDAFPDLEEAGGVEAAGAAGFLPVFSGEAGFEVFLFFFGEMDSLHEFSQGGPCFFYGRGGAFVQFFCFFLPDPLADHFRPDGPEAAVDVEGEVDASFRVEGFQGFEEGGGEFACQFFPVVGAGA